MLSINEIAPEFALKDELGKIQQLSEQRGVWVLLYFYPKDDTPGCTKEACMIRDVYDDFARRGVKVFGVSKDTPASHARFKKKYELPFTLLSDPEGKMIARYGAWQKKLMFGKTFMGIKRMSYLIDAEGKIAAVYPDVDPAQHALELLRDLQRLQRE